MVITVNYGLIFTNTVTISQQHVGMMFEEDEKWLDGGVDLADNFTARLPADG